jgi:hypothetical protein
MFWSKGNLSLVNGKNTFKKPEMITDGDGEGTKTKPQECQQGTCNKQ